MSNHVIPRSDGAFDVWQSNFVEFVAAHYGDLGLSGGDADRLKSARETWLKAYGSHIQRRQAAKAARENKDAERRAFERMIRLYVRRIQPFEKVTDAQRAALGITVRDVEPSPVGPPKTRPVVTIDFSKRLRHTLRYADEATPTRRARPAGVIGVEVWCKVTDAGQSPPKDPGEYAFKLLSTRTPAVVEFSGDNAGNTAHYLLRWLTGRGESGTWSDTASATIGA